MTHTVATLFRKIAAKRLVVFIESGYSLLCYPAGYFRLVILEVLLYFNVPSLLELRNLGAKVTF